MHEDAAIPTGSRPTPEGRSRSGTHELSRVVRIGVSPLGDASRADNGTVGFAAPGLGAIAEFEVACRGTPAESGYVVDITLVDRAAADVLRPRIAASMREEATSGRATDLPGFLRAAAAELAAALPARLVRLRFCPSPRRSVALELRDPPSRDAPSAYDPSPRPALRDERTDWNDPMSHHVVLSESFEFAASHRLALPELDDEGNRALFGKCSNPNGHGHNYRIDVEVEVDLRTGSGPAFGFPELARAVSQEIMRRFDHRHLNLDCPEFAGVNPSVERIAETCHRLLAPAIEAGGARLRSVRVWETEKTSCRFPA